MKVNLLKDDIKKMYFVLLASAIGSTLVSTIYSTVDMICVGHYCGPEGTAAISCINPLWSLMMALGFLAGVGGAVMMANRRGAQDERAAHEYFTVGVIFAIFWSIIIGIAFFFFSEPLLRFFGAEEGAVLDNAITYLKSISVVSPTFTMCACLSAFMRNDGEAVIPTVATIAGGVINIILDVLLVFDFGAGMGIFGAGLATATGQMVAFVIIAAYFFTKKCNLKFVRPTRTLRKLMRISTVGFAAFILEISFGITVTVYNNVIVSHLSESHLAVYGTASTLLAMFCCLFNGVGVALQPISAANFGAKQHSRVSHVLRLSLICAAVMGVLFFLATMLMPNVILNIYMQMTDEVVAIAPDNILRIYTAALPIMGLSALSTYYFQSVLKQSLSVLISLLRGFLLPVAFILLIPLVAGYDAIWWSMPLAEAVTFLVAAAAIIITRIKGRKAENIAP